MSFPINKNAPEQRLYTFIQQLSKVGGTPDFILNKAFDYALSLPEITNLKSTAARLEGATILLVEVGKIHAEEAREQEKELMKNLESVESSEEEAVPAT